MATWCWPAPLRPPGSRERGERARAMRGVLPGRVGRGLGGRSASARRRHARDAAACGSAPSGARRARWTADTPRSARQRAHEKKHPGADASVSAEFGALSALYRQCAKDYPEAAEPADEALPYLVPTVGDKADYGARHADAHGASSSDIATWSRSHIASARAVGLLPKSVTDAARAEIARSRVNDFFIQRWTGGDPEPIAAAVFPLGALLNHSCAPTCVASTAWTKRRTAPSRRGYKSSGAARSRCAPETS